MKNTFFNKVTFERKVVDVVNSSDRYRAQLAGLSRAAIETWQRKVSLASESELVSLLVNLGQLCQTLSDRSHESFRSLRPDVEAAIETGLVKLESLLRSSKG